MLFLFFGLIYAILFQVKGTSLIIYDSGNITKSAVISACDINQIDVIIIQEGPTSLDMYCFQAMKKLRSITIGPSVTDISGFAFQDNYALEEIIVDSNPAFTVDSYNVLYTSDMTKLVKAQNFLPKIFKIPRSVTIIGDLALSGQQIMTYIIIPNTVTSIGKSFLMYPKYMNSIEFESGIIISNLTCFGYSSNEPTLTIPKSVTVINSGCFWRNNRLANVIFENGSLCERIETNGFAHCYSLLSFTFPPLIKTVGTTAFLMDKSLKFINIPASLEQLDVSTFNGATGITSITIDPENQNLTVVDNAILMKSDGSETYYVVTSVNSLTLSASVSTIGLNALQSCQNLSSINVDPSNTYFYARDGILYDSKKSKAIAAVGGIKTAKILENVTEISTYCFGFCQKLTSIILNSKLVTIRDYAFYSCTQLKSIQFPATLKNIYSYAFSSATSLTDIDILGDSLEVIGPYVFVNTKIQSFAFSSKLKSLDHESFSGVTTLTSITFNETCPLEKIRYMTFQNTRIRSIIIPRNVQTIEYNAFYNSINMVELTFANSSVIDDIQYYAFTNANITNLILPKTLTKLSMSSFLGAKLLTGLVFEAGMNLSTIGPSCFKECLKLRHVQLPSSITRIDPTTFYGCTELISIDIPADNENYQSKNGIVYSKSGDRLVTCPAGLSSASITDTILVIGLNAFFGCSKLQTIIFEPGCKLETMEEGTFASCTSLKRIDLPTSLQTVQKGAFEGCTNLETITFPDYCAVNLDADSIFANCISLTKIKFGVFCALTIIGEHEFSCCYNLTTITIPANCTTIGAYAFENCSSLSSIKYELNSKIASFGEGAFSGCYSLNDYYVPDVFKSITSECFGSAPNISRVFIEPNLKIDRIGSNAFSTFPLKEFIIGQGTTVSTIESNAFAGRSIIGIRLNNTVLIGNNAFQNCVNMNYAIFEGISSIGNSAFAGCTCLSDFNISTNCKSIGNSAFSGCNKLKSIRIQGGSLTTIGSSTFIGCSSLSSIRIPSSVINIGSNSFQNLLITSFTFVETSSLLSISDNLFNGCSKLTSISIPNNVKSIGLNSFQNCKSLTTITLSTSSAITFIANYAFYGCTSLNSFSIPPNLLTIGNNAFQNDNSLTAVSFLGTSKMTSIGTSSFSGCALLGSFSLPKTCTTINNNAFENCNNLATFSITSSSQLSNIGQSAFLGCSKLKSFTVDHSVSLGTNAFKDCNSMTKFSAPSINNIGTSCFANCISLQSIELKLASTITTIPQHSFENCSQLESIQIPSTVTTIECSAFRNCKILNFGRYDNIKTIKDFAFYSTNSVEVPSDLVTVGSFAFYGSLVIDRFKHLSGNRFVFPSSIKSVGQNSFKKTGIDILLYCGGRNMTIFNNIFDAKITIKVTQKYEHNTFCGLNVVPIRGYSCNSFFITGIGNAALYRAELIKYFGINLFIFCFISM